MTEFTQEIKRLQKLSCISLSPQEEQKLWAQLTDIIGFLGKLPQTKDISWSKQSKDLSITKMGKLTLRTIKGVRQNTDTKKLLKNVKHEIVNNSIVIKSVLS
ncbi:MAG: hypothetical protein ACD_80C00046G0019 [uncultured bacterium (gcode 4)]|uniref:Uncharacterized protein n=1 Tax=uncultured bacterium (gcode 4) TaxID=1234023 RepID=K1XJY2_9BACT|nr:MAG: hypothetical protein ACD_80C00046G0019 [uncultured bacterium (gcode 4)]